MKKSIIFIFSGLLLATLYQSCNDCFTLGNCPPEYHFRAIDSLIRDHDTVSVGDTIWLGTSISDSLQKHPPQTGKVYFPNAEVSIKVDFKNNEGDEFANPEVVIESGNYDNWGYGSSVHFEHKNNRYYHKVGLILNKSGVYYINLYTSWAEIVDDCKCNDAQIHPTLYVNMNRNLHLVPKELINQIDTNMFAAFVVK